MATSFKQDQDAKEDVGRRAPLPASVPRPVKRESGRTETLRTPAHVRVIGIEIDEENRALIRRKLGMKLGKFVASIERVTVRVTDHGPVSRPRCRTKELCPCPSESIHFRFICDRCHRVTLRPGIIDLPLRAHAAATLRHGSALTSKKEDGQSRQLNKCPQRRHTLEVFTCPPHYLRIITRMNATACTQRCDTRAGRVL